MTKKKLPHEMTWKEYEQSIEERLNRSGNKGSQLLGTIRAKELLKSLGFTRDEISVKTPFDQKHQGYGDTVIDIKSPYKDKERQKQMLDKMEELARGGYEVRIFINGKSKEDPLSFIKARPTYSSYGKIKVHDLDIDMDKKGHTSMKKIPAVEDEVKLAWENYKRRAKSTQRLSREGDTVRGNIELSVGAVRKHRQKHSWYKARLRDKNGTIVYKRDFPTFKFEEDDVKRAVEKKAKKLGVKVKWGK